MNLLLKLIEGIPPVIATMIVAATPIAELRGSIPLAIGVYHLPVWQAFLYSVIGNTIPIFFVYFIFELIYRLLSKNQIAKGFFEWLFARTRKKFQGQYALYGEIALVIFVAIPLPMTGAWTGALAAWLFGIKPRIGIPLVFAGVVISGIIVTLLTVGVGALIN